MQFATSPVIDAICREVHRRCLKLFDFSRVKRTCLRKSADVFHVIEFHPGQGRTPQTASLVVNLSVIVPAAGQRPTRPKDLARAEPAFSQRLTGEAEAAAQGRWIITPDTNPVQVADEIIYLFTQFGAPLFERFKDSSSPGFRAQAVQVAGRKAKS